MHFAGLQGGFGMLPPRPAFSIAQSHDPPISLVFSLHELQSLGILGAYFKLDLFAEQHELYSLQLSRFQDTQLAIGDTGNGIHREVFDSVVRSKLVNEM